MEEKKTIAIETTEESTAPPPDMTAEESVQTDSTPTIIVEEEATEEIAAVPASAEPDPILDSVNEELIVAEAEPSPDSPVSEEEALAVAASDEVPAPAESAPQPVVPVPVKPPVAKAGSKKWLIVALVALVLILGAAAAIMLLTQGKQQAATQEPTNNSLSTPTAKLGLAVSLVEGTASFVPVGGTSQPLTTGSQLKEGDSVSTGADSRAVLTFDDGSALRLDQHTKVTLVSLSADNLRITQDTGTAYSRLVKSERSYAVTVDGTTYTAQGTAFATTSGQDKGVQVYESAVKVDGLADAVTEGKQYYKQHHDSNIAGKVTAIDLDTLGKDSFAAWNLSEDEKSTLFKDKLGVFVQLKDKQAKDKVKREAEKKKSDEHSGVAAGLRLSAKAVTGGAELSWMVTAVDAPYGFKLVRSSSSATPTFGRDDSLYVDNGATRRATWHSTKDGTYWYRVCIYQKEAGCDNYSNAVQVTVTGSKPKEDKKPAAKVTRGTLTLHSVDNTGKAHWSFTGKAPHGYKLLVSKSADPTYPGSSAAYIGDSEATYGHIPAVGKAGTYYVRICAYTNGSEAEACVNYSNQVVYTKQ